MLDQETARERVLDAAEDLFYARGIHSVGMDEVRNASGVSLKRLYGLFPSKEALVREFLHRRDLQWRRALAEHVEAREAPDERIFAIFDWLHAWFSEPGYRGCAFINSFGEWGAVSAEVAEEVRRHKSAFRDYVAGLVEASGRPAELADPLVLLAEGAITTAAIRGTAEPARHARHAARSLMRSCGA